MSVEWRPCGYGCGKPWRVYPRTKLIGHRVCAVPLEAMEDLARLYWRFPRLTIARMSRDFGVSVSVMTSWVRLGRRRLLASVGMLGVDGERGDCGR